jgi:hypothetical protein
LDDAGREFTGSGYRVGTARAQGPDPYGRFEGGDEESSNVRHFPTRDREVGDELKLSGLLGPSTNGENSSVKGKSNRSRKASRKASRKRGDSSKSSDDSE